MRFVFFIDTEVRLSGRQKYFLDFAAYLADHTSNEVFFVNHNREEDIKQYVNSKLIFLNIDDTDYSRFEDATFFTPINYTFHLLSRIFILKNAKILLYVYDSGCMSRFFGQNFSKAPIADCLSLIKSKGCCLFSDGRVFYDSCLKYGFFNRDMFPVTSCQFKDSTENFVDIISDDCINIAYANGMNSLDQAAITNLCNNLLKIDINKKINLHLIGPNNGFTRIDQSVYSPQIRIIYAGNLQTKERIAYFKSNVDLVVAYDILAVECMAAALPTVVPIISDKNQVDNRYVLGCDANEFVYKWDRENLLFLRNVSHSINYILHEIYVQHNKIKISKRCFEYFKNYCNIDLAISKFEKFAQNNRMSLVNLMQSKYVSSQIGSFLKAREVDNILTYNSFIHPVNNKVAPKVKKNFFLDLNNFVTKHIPSRLQYRKYYKVNRSYRRKIKLIRRRIAEGKKIKVAYIVVFNSVFPVRPVFENMLNDAVFDPYIIVAPNVSRTYKYMIDTYKEALSALTEQYGDRVIGGYDIETDDYLELKDDYAILFFCNPYKHLVNPLHHVEYFLNKNCLPIYSSYGFAALKFFDEVIATDFYNYMWKACVETSLNLEYLKAHEKIQGRNGVITGYIKMDKYASVKRSNNIRKRILICPHHTVWGWKTLNISNFLKYSELFIKLPEIFSDIDFVFRPHPLLFPNLKAHGIWTEYEIEGYMTRLLSHSNMTYDKSGDYMQQFADSDAMIHDCGSFIGEYLYTEKPCCYMMKSLQETMDNLIPLGQVCMQHYYHAFKEDDIINFIKDVVINGEDPKKENRVNFVERELKINYPNAAKFVCDMIKRELRVK